MPNAQDLRRRLSRLLDRLVPPDYGEADAIRAHLNADGEHVYLSTGCLHGNHGHCQARTSAAGKPKAPAQCKFCSAPCVCRCHTKNKTADQPEPT